MNSKTSADEKLKYLQEHLLYERAMLEYSFQLLHTSDIGGAWNVAFESFGIHARNIYNFLRNDGSSTTTYRAGDYANNWMTPDAFLKFNDLNVFLFHMSTKREVREKFSLEMLQQLGNWIDEEWNKWVNGVDALYSSALTSDPVCRIPNTLNPSLSANSACTSIQTEMSVSTNAKLPQEVDGKITLSVTGYKPKLS